MAQHRTEKINELLKRELSRLVLEETEFGSGVLVTVMAVQTDEDLDFSTVYFSVLPENKGDLVWKVLTGKASDFHWHLKKKLRLNPVPKLKFQLDKSEAESQQVDELIEEIKKQEPDDR